MGQDGLKLRWRQPAGLATTARACAYGVPRFRAAIPAGPKFPERTETMKTAASSDSALLAQIEDMVTQALTELTARQQAERVEEVPNRNPERRERLLSCQEGIRRLESGAGAVAGQLAEADSALANHEQQLQHFLTSAAN